MSLVKSDMNFYGLLKSKGIRTDYNVTPYQWSVSVSVNTPHCHCGDGGFDSRTDRKKELVDLQATCSGKVANFHYQMVYRAQCPTIGMTCIEQTPAEDRVQEKVQVLYLVIR